jgi:hypothetical protein
MPAPDGTGPGPNRGGPGRPASITRRPRIKDPMAAAPLPDRWQTVAFRRVSPPHPSRGGSTQRNKFFEVD